MPTLPSRRQRRGLAFAAFACVASIPSTAYGAFVVGEQVDRGDGASGGAPWQQNAFAADAPFARPFAISDDGRFAFITYPTVGHVRGLYRRDVQLNTLRLVADDVRPTGWTRAGQYLSVLTPKALSPADANATADLYLLDPFSGAATLASKAPDGAALGEVTSGAVTADGTAVVYSRPGGTERRVLSAAAATRLSTRAMPPYEDTFLPHLNTGPHANVTRSGLSTDGTRVVLEGGAVGAASGEVVLPTDADGKPLPWVLSPTGTDASRVAKNAAGVWEVVVFNLATRQERTLSTGASHLEQLWINSVSADGTKAHVSASLRRNNSPLDVLGTVDLRTGAIAQTSDDIAPYRYPRVFAWNDRYGVFGDINLFAIPTQAGAALPGGVDLPSPLVYLNYSEGCTSASFLTPYGGRPSVEFTRRDASRRGLAPVVSQVTVAVRAGAGSPVINRFTLSSLKPDAPINQTPSAASPTVGVAKVEASVSAGGKTAYDAATVPSYYASRCFI